MAAFPALATGLEPTPRVGPTSLQVTSLALPVKGGACSEWDAGQERKCEAQSTVLHEHLFPVGNPQILVFLLWKDSSSMINLALWVMAMLSPGRKELDCVPTCLFLGL